MLVIDRLRALLVPAGHPGIGPRRRPSAWAEDDLRRRTDDTLRSTALPPLRRDQVLALVLCWHDHLEASHALVQAHEGDAECDLVHAVIHRREGDAENARYWLRGLGRHPAWDHLAPVAAAENLPELTDRRGRWRAEAFLDRCLAADPALVPGLARIQAAELLALADHIASHPSSSARAPRIAPPGRP